MCVYVWMYIVSALAKAVLLWGGGRLLPRPTSCIHPKTKKENKVKCEFGFGRERGGIGNPAV